MPAPYPDQRRDAIEKLKTVFERKPYVRIIHYSCESFDDRPSGQSPRITAIAIRKLDDAQTVSFSIHAVAERRGVPIAQIPGNYDDLEREMLRDFFNYVEGHKDIAYLHWNMRDKNYGFQAIEHRYEALMKTTRLFPEGQRYDLSRILLEMYGTEYIEHPRLENLARKNEMTMERFLGGKDEAEAFIRGKYVALEQSTLRKVDLLDDIAERAYRQTLKTISNWWVQHGGNIRGAWNWIVTNATILFLIGLAGVAIGAVALYAGLLALKH